MKLFRDKSRREVMEWPLKYTDDNGIVETKIYSDGKNLRTRLRGVIFEGTDLAIEVCTF